MLFFIVPAFMVIIIPCLMDHGWQYCLGTSYGPLCLAVQFRCPFWGNVNMSRRVQTPAFARMNNLAFTSTIIHHLPLCTTISLFAFNHRYGKRIDPARHRIVQNHSAVDYDRTFARWQAFLTLSYQVKKLAFSSISGGLAARQFTIIHMECQSSEVTTSYKS